MTSWISSDAVKEFICGDIDDATAQALAATATGLVRDYLGRDLEQKDYDELYPSTYTDYVLLRAWPVSKIVSVGIDGYVTPLQPGGVRQQGWMIDPDVPRKLRFAGYGRLPRCDTPIIHVVYTAGYPIGPAPDAASSPWFAGTGLPPAIVAALKLTVSALSNAQAADPNLVSESTVGVFSGVFQPTGVGAIPPGARTYLEPYVKRSP